MTHLTVLDARRTVTADQAQYVGKHRMLPPTPQDVRIYPDTPRTPVRLPRFARRAIRDTLTADGPIGIYLKYDLSLWILPDDEMPEDFKFQGIEA